MGADYRKLGSFEIHSNSIVMFVRANLRSNSEGDQNITDAQIFLAMKSAIEKVMIGLYFDLIEIRSYEKKLLKLQKSIHYPAM